MSRTKWLWRNWFNKKPLWEGLLYIQNATKMATTNIVPDLINANLDVIEDQVLSKLNEDLYGLSKAASDAIGETAQVMFDGEEPNGPQVEAVWRKFVNEHLVDFATIKATQEAEKINSEILRNLSVLLLNPASSSLKALTDEITDDGEQLKQLWADFLLEGTNLKALLDNSLRPALKLLPIISDSFADLLIGLAESEIRRALQNA